MSCNCIEEVEERAKDVFLEQNPDKEIVENVALSHTALMLDKYRGVELHGKVTAKYKDGKRNRNWEANLRFKYCPFCGKKYKAEVF